MAKGRKNGKEPSWRKWARIAGKGDVSEAEFMANREAHQTEALSEAEKVMNSALRKFHNQHDAVIAYHTGLHPATVARYRSQQRYGSYGPRLTTYLALKAYS